MNNILLCSQQRILTDFGSVQKQSDLMQWEIIFFINLQILFILISRTICLIIHLGHEWIKYKTN